MISQRPFRHPFPCCPIPVDDMKILSDCVEQFCVEQIDCPDCGDRSLFRIDSSESFTDAACRHPGCRARVEIKGIRCQGAWLNATIDDCKKGFRIKLGSRKGFDSVFRKGYAHLIIIGYSYEVEKGYDIENDKSARGIINQKFRFGLILNRRIVKEMCDLQGVLDETSDEVCSETGSEENSETCSETCNETNSETGNDASSETGSETNSETNSEASSNLHSETKDILDHEMEPPIQFVFRGKKIDMIVSSKGFDLFDVFEPKRASRQILKRQSEIQREADEAMLLVSASNQFHFQANRNRKRQRKQERKLKKKMKKKFSVARDNSQ